MTNFNTLIQSALAQEFSGWDFAYLDGRWDESPTPWSYRDLVIEAMQGIDSMLDMGTGGGEFLASLPGLPAYTAATEAYEPNVAVATQQLQPLGVRVVQLKSDQHLPFEDDTFDLIINRHESFDAAEVVRVLKPGGRFLTQQVGGEDCIDLNRLLDAPDPVYLAWSLDVAARQLEAAGLDIVRREHARPVTTIHDIGALVFYCKVISWQFPDFSVDRYRDRLQDLHTRIEREGSLRVWSERFLIEGVMRNS
ncbi:MAG: class I SAM-dependent methyltransferase [Caldilineaceae bacterium]